MSISQLSVKQLERAIEIKRQIESLQHQLDSMQLDGNGDVAPRRGRPKRIAVDGRIAALKKARAVRMANLLAKKDGDPTEQIQLTPVIKARRKQKRAVSPEHKAKLSEAAKARWAKAKSKENN